MAAIRRLPHGYTNDTVATDSVVVKTYAGPDADVRRKREHAILVGLADRLPLPPVLDHRAFGDDVGGGSLTLGFVPGTPGQDLLAPEVDPEVAAAALAACGTILSRIHSVDAVALVNSVEPAELAAVVPRETDGVLVHGDFGPNNLLIAPESMAVSGIVDWEFARIGAPIVDLAWCEWIVRTHHPDRVPLLDAFFDAYAGDIPPFADRQAAMVERCRELLEFCERWEPGSGGVDQWRRRLATTASWTAGGVESGVTAPYGT